MGLAIAVGSIDIVGGGGGAVGNVVGGATGTPLLEGERDALVVERLCRAVHVPASQRALSATERHLGSRHPDATGVLSHLGSGIDGIGHRLVTDLRSSAATDDGAVAWCGGCAEVLRQARIVVARHVALDVGAGTAVTPLHRGLIQTVGNVENRGVVGIGRDDAVGYSLLGHGAGILGLCQAHADGHAEFQGVGILHPLREVAVIDLVGVGKLRERATASLDHRGDDAEGLVEVGHQRVVHLLL